MAVTLTLKNIPDAVYQRLKASAETNRRSMNSEAIVCLESALSRVHVPANDRLARARALRTGLKTTTFDATTIDAFKRQGRS